MDFRTFVRILGAHWKLALTALLACTVGAAFVTALQTKHYQSSATVLISFSGATDLNEVYSGTQAAQNGCRRTRKSPVDTSWPSAPSASSNFPCAPMIC